MISDLMILQKVPGRKPLAMFGRMFGRGVFLQLLAKLTGRSFHMLDIDELLKNYPLEASHRAGVKSVSIDRIRGTLGKAGEFDADFNPIQERSRIRWMAVAREKLQGRELPPVELIQVGQIYYVCDGHHRISVSRALGQAYIDAEVTIMRLRNLPR